MRYCRTVVLLTCFIIKNIGFSQCGDLISHSVYPTNPINSDTTWLNVQVYCNMIYSLQSYNVQVSGNIVDVDVYYCQGLATVVSYTNDTLPIGVLTQGNYNYNLNIHTAFNSTGCSLYSITDFGSGAFVVKDSCTDIVNIDQLSVTDVSCFNYQDGSVTVQVSGGDPPYLYNLGSGNQSSATFNNLSEGSYTMQVSESGGCTVDIPISIDSPNELLIGSYSDMEIICSDSYDGWISVVPAGGTPSSNGYIYSWNTGDSTAFVDSLPGGNYMLVISDSIGCVDTTYYTINELQPLVLTTIVQPESLGNDGEIDLTVSGGWWPYDYDWDNDGWSDVDDTQDLAGLSSGVYSVIVYDAYGCVDTLSVNVPSIVGLETSLFNEDIEFQYDLINSVIRIKSNQQGSVIIYNANGQTVKRADLKRGDSQIDLDGFPNGMYFSTINQCGRAKTYKFIIN